MPILTSALNPQAYGIAALVGTVISLMSVLALGGIDVTYTRAFPRGGTVGDAGVERFCWRYAMGAALVTSVICGATWLTVAYASLEGSNALPYVVASGIVLSVVSTMSQTRARLGGRYVAMAVALVVSGVVGASASILVALVWRQDAAALLLAMLLGYVIPIVMLGVLSPMQLVRPSGLDARDRAELLKIGLGAIVTAPMYWLLSSSDRWFLHLYHGAEVVGVYSIGCSVGLVGMMFNAAVASVWLPESIREYQDDRSRARETLGRLMSRVIAAMALVWLAVTAGGGDIIRWLADPRFHQSADYVPLIAGGAFFYGLSQVALSVLVLVHQLKCGAVWWLFGGLVSVILNVLIVPIFGGWGAALVQAISFGFIALGILTFSQIQVRLILQWKALAATAVIVVVAGVFLAPPFSQSAPISLLAKLPFGIGLAAIVSVMIAPDWCGKAARRLGRRPS